MKKVKKVPWQVSHWGWGVLEKKSDEIRVAGG